MKWEGDAGGQAQATSWQLELKGVTLCLCLAEEACSVCPTQPHHGGEWGLLGCLVHFPRESRAALGRSGGNVPITRDAALTGLGQLHFSWWGMTQKERQ